VNPTAYTSTPATDEQIQDLIALLLDRAVTVAYALTQLQTLADTCRPNPTARAEVDQAITEMTAIRATLIGNADHLSRLLQDPPSGE
jgi:hypothetical protein